MLCTKLPTPGIHQKRLEKQTQRSNLHQPPDHQPPEHQPSSTAINRTTKSSATINSHQTITKPTRQTINHQPTPQNPPQQTSTNHKIPRTKSNQNSPQSRPITSKPEKKTINRNPKTTQQTHPPKAKHTSGWVTPYGAATYEPVGYLMRHPA